MLSHPTVCANITAARRTNVRVHVSDTQRHAVVSNKQIREEGFCLPNLVSQYQQLMASCFQPWNQVVFRERFSSCLYINNKASQNVHKQRVLYGCLKYYSKMYCASSKWLHSQDYLSGRKHVLRMQQETYTSHYMYIHIACTPSSKK